VGRELAGINAQVGLPDHAALNRDHYPWAEGRYPGAQIYGSRLWEYPFAVLAADVRAGMACADVGCGSTPFTVYLARQPGVSVTGFDPDVFAEGTRAAAFGVSAAFIQRTGLDIRACGITRLDAPSNHFDRVFCLSVIEHLDADTARRGMREMARVLKPGGRLVVTVDVAILDTFNDVDPLSLIWESGLLVAGSLDVAWPRHRLGIGYHGGHPADVFGMVLEKSDGVVDSCYAAPGASVPSIACSSIPGLRQPRQVDLRPIPWMRRLRMASRFFVRGTRLENGKGNALP
jgi:SAM-dependent methyltransferase